MKVSFRQYNKTETLPVMSIIKRKVNGHLCLKYGCDVYFPVANFVIFHKGCPILFEVYEPC